MNKPIKQWSMLEYTLLGVAAVLLLTAAGLTAVVPGGLIGGGDTPSATPTLTAGLPGDIPGPAETQTLTLSPATGAPGATIKAQGQGWPAGSRIVISLVPTTPPAYTGNSAIVDNTGSFTVEIIVPSDPRWLEESPVPVLAQLDDGSRSAQAMLTIVSPTIGGDKPAVTPAPITTVTPVRPAVTPTPPPPSVAQLTVNANALNVRTGPNLNYGILGVLLNGQKAEVTGRNTDATWWQIKFPSGDGRAWVSAAYATAENIGNVPIVAAPPPTATSAHPYPPAGHHHHRMARRIFYQSQLAGAARPGAQRCGGQLRLGAGVACPANSGR
jgi:uncharacterized protein YraI